MQDHQSIILDLLNPPKQADCQTNMQHPEGSNRPVDTQTKDLRSCSTGRTHLHCSINNSPFVKAFSFKIRDVPFLPFTKETHVLSCGKLTHRTAATCEGLRGISSSGTAAAVKPAHVRAAERPKLPTFFFDLRISALLKAHAAGSEQRPPHGCGPGRPRWPINCIPDPPSVPQLRRPRRSGHDPAPRSLPPTCSPPRPPGPASRRTCPFLGCKASVFRQGNATSRRARGRAEAAPPGRGAAAAAPPRPAPRPAAVPGPGAASRCWLCSHPGRF